MQNTVDGYLVGAIEADVCDAAIYSEHSWRARRSFGVRQYCDNYVRLPEMITELSNAIPVRSEIEQAVSAFIQTDRDSGLYEELEVQAQRNYTYSVCPELKQQHVRSVFGFNDFGGLLALPIISAAIIARAKLLHWTAFHVAQTTW